MAAGRTYFKKGTQPPQHAGYTGVFAGEDGILRSIQDDGTVTLLQASGSIPGSGLSYEGFYLNVGAGTGILVDATNVALDTGYLDTNYAASGNYIIKSVADATYQPVGNYEASGTGDAKVAVHNAIWDHNSFVINTLSVLAGAGLSGGGDLSTDRTFNVGEGWGIIVQANSVAVASGTLDSRYALSGVPVVNTLNDLSDVSVAAPASGTRLTFDGSNWVATPVAAGENLTKGEADALYQPLGSYEASGAADTERAAHEAAADPHPLYLLEADAATTYEASGTADTERAAHEAASDPHPQYLTQAEGDVLYQASGVGSIAKLTDVTLGTLASGNQLSWNGTAWINEPKGAGGGGASALDDLTDVNAGTPTSGQYLSWNGSQWINAVPEGTGGGGASISLTKETIQTRTLIEEWVADGTEVDFRSTVIPSGYDYLVLEGVTRNSSTSAGGYDSPYLAFNDDTTDANYHRQYVWTNDDAETYDEATSRQFVALQSDAHADASYASWRVEIGDYAHTDREKLVRAVSVVFESIDGPNQTWNLIKWDSNAAVSGIRITSASNTWDAGSTIRIYGVKDEEVVTDVTGNAAGEPSLVVATSGQQEVRELIARIELMASSGTLHFQNISQNFDHLEYRVRGRSDGGTSNVGTSIMFNGDATAENYDVTTHYFAGNEANAVTHTSTSNEDTRRGGVAVGAAQAAGLFSNVAGRIDWYSRNNAVKHWVVDSVWAESDGNAIFYKMEEAGRWNSNDAITNIEYDCDTGNFASGTIMELWGIKTQWVVTSGQYGSLNISNGLIVP